MRKYGDSRISRICFLTQGPSLKMSSSSIAHDVSSSLSLLSQFISISTSILVAFDRSLEGDGQGIGDEAY